MELITGRPAINNNLPLRICYKNVIKLVCIYHFSKKKNVEWICGDGIAEIGGKKKLLQLVCGNGIAEIEGEKL